MVKIFAVNSVDKIVVLAIHAEFKAECGMCIFVKLS